AQGYTQEEGIDYDEVFAPVARIKSIRLFLAYASFMGFMVYQIDVKSTFLYSQIEEEVYVCQRLGFEDLDYLNKVYKVVTALYGLHQDPRAWYETLAMYLLDNRFHRGKIDQTLFIKKQKGDILLVQVYVDDIIFGFTKKDLCLEFEKLMHDKFQMSSIGERTFFLGLQVKQKEHGIFISGDKYVTDILNKFGFQDVRTARTPMDTEKPLLKDSDGDDVDVHLYRSMIGSLMYLTLSKPDIMFAVCLWYPRDSSFDLVAYSDSDYAGASLDRKSKTGGCQFIGCILISWQCKKQTVVGTSSTEAEYVAVARVDFQDVFLIDQNPSISLVQDEGTSWIQEDAKIQGKTSADTEILLDQEEPTKLVEDLGSGEKGEKEISTANISVSTASSTPEVSTAAKNLVYTRRSAEKRKDKGKAIMKEDESVQKKAKKQLEQERLGHEEAIRLQEQINEEERQRIDRDAEIAKQLQEESDKARQEQEVVAEADQAHDIDWSDPSVLRYHALQNRSFTVAEVRKNMCMYLKNQGRYKQIHFKGMSYEDIRLIFERVWDQNHVFIPKDSEIEKEVMERPGFDFLQKSIKKNDKIKALGFVQKQPAEEEKEKKNDDSQQQAGSSKKRSREDFDENNVKKQKLKDDAKKEELRDCMDVVPRDDIAINVESLATKYLIVNWKTHVLTENMMYYQIIRADGSSKNYKIFSEMLDDFDRQDVMDLHRLDYNLISWRLFNSCGIHILLRHTGIAIHMTIEKKYPLTQEMLSRMLSRRLEVDQESEMAFELLRFIRSQLQK
ncbi:putative ribonuclease H-like domain-containing protein, partial [Tanacetum coccineum]